MLPQKATPLAMVVRNSRIMYRDRLNGMQILLNRTQARPGRAVKQEQEQNSRNHVQTFGVGYRNLV